MKHSTEKMIKISISILRNRFVVKKINKNNIIKFGQNLLFKFLSFLHLLYIL